MFHVVSPQQFGEYKSGFGFVSKLRFCLFAVTFLSKPGTDEAFVSFDALEKRENDDSRAQDAKPIIRRRAALSVVNARHHSRRAFIKLHQILAKIPRLLVMAIAEMSEGSFVHEKYIDIIVVELLALHTDAKTAKIGEDFEHLIFALLKDLRDLYLEAAFFRTEEVIFICRNNFLIHLEYVSEFVRFYLGFCFDQLIELQKTKFILPRIKEAIDSLVDQSNECKDSPTFEFEKFLDTKRIVFPNYDCL